MVKKTEKKKNITDHLRIKAWAVADRPREKLKQRGKQELSNAELIAIILGSGSPKESALALAQRILIACKQDLNELGNAELKELQHFRGVGEVKAIKILAALELGRRRQLTSISERPMVSSSQDAFAAIASLIIDLPHEEFWILLLNRANKIIGRERISSGGVAGTVVDAKVVFRKAVQQLACSIILAHNHPSGNLRPSQADKNLTEKLVNAGKAIDIVVLDHLIISSEGYFSFADESLI